MRTATLKLPKGTKITNPANAQLAVLSSPGFLDMDPSSQVSIAAGTNLFIPGLGKVKAITGTELKANAKVGTAESGGPSPSLEMVLPACTLREPSNNGKETNLDAGTKIKTKEGQGSILVLAELKVVPV